MKFSDASLLEDDGLELNLTPLIDIVFLLLIFFMVSTTFIGAADIKVSLPSAKSNISAKQSSPIVVSIAKDGGVFIDKARVQLTELKSKLSGQSSSTLIVRADQQARHGRVVEVMDLAREAGISKLAIAVDPRR